MDEKKLWNRIFLVCYFIGIIYFFLNYNFEDYLWEIFVFVLVACLFDIVRSYFFYKKRLRDFKGKILLSAKEKWDFLYQDVWVLISIIIVLICVLLIPLNDASVVMYINLIIFSRILFNKLILRNRLIVDEKQIAFSKSGDFSEIKFRLVKGMIFDEDEGRVTINYEKIIPPKHSFLSTKSKTLDIDEIEVTKNEIKVLERQGLFKKDWNDFKIILDRKSKEYDFGLSVVYPI